MYSLNGNASITHYLLANCTILTSGIDAVSNSTSSAVSLAWSNLVSSSVMPGKAIDGQAVGNSFEGLTEQERKTGYHYVVNQPSVFIAAHIDYVRIVRLLPLAVGQTELQVDWLFSEESLADKSINIEEAAAFAKLVMQQDAMVSELNQKGLQCIEHQHGVLMPEEYDVHNFQNWVREQLKTQ